MVKYVWMDLLVLNMLCVWLMETLSICLSISISICPAQMCMHTCWMWLYMQYNLSWWLKNAGIPLLETQRKPSVFLHIPTPKTWKRKSSVFHIVGAESAPVLINVQKCSSVIHLRWSRSNLMPEMMTKNQQRQSLMCFCFQENSSTIIERMNCF